MSFLRINRRGVVHTNKAVPNQCKVEGHTEYNYYIALVCCDSNLDKNQFIIDHQEIHNLVERYFKLRISSCEKQVIELGKRLLKAAKRHNIHVVDIYIALRPTGHTTVAFMEWSLTGQFMNPVF